MSCCNGQTLLNGGESMNGMILALRPKAGSRPAKPAFLQSKGRARRHEAPGLSGRDMSGGKVLYRLERRERWYPSGGEYPGDEGWQGEDLPVTCRSVDGVLVAQ